MFVTGDMMRKVLGSFRDGGHDGELLGSFRDGGHGTLAAKF